MTETERERGREAPGVGASGPDAGEVTRATGLDLVESVARAHPGLLLSGAYLAATGIGMLSSWTLYGRFGVNIFHYAQLPDFIVAAVRTPAASAAVLLALPAVWFILVTDDWLMRSFSWYEYLYGPRWLRRLSRSTGAYLFYGVLYAYAFSLLYSGHVAADIRAGNGPEVSVQLQSGTYRERSAIEPFRATLLGTTSAYVLLYEPADGSVTVVPTENVAMLTVE